MGKRSRKGGVFERSFCKSLSLWWTDGEADDCFWRTAGSGARATTRGRKGKKTRGHSGDISATDKEGEPLIQLITFELKCGYGGQSGCTLLDVLDKRRDMKEQRWEEWIRQASTSSAMAGTEYWMLIQKRDSRIPLCFFPTSLMNHLPSRASTHLKGSAPIIRAVIPIGADSIAIYGLPLDTWFQCVLPESIKSLHKEWFPDE